MPTGFEATIIWSSRDGEFRFSPLAFLLASLLAASPAASDLRRYYCWRRLGFASAAFTSTTTSWTSRGFVSLTICSLMLFG
ncbi:MAG: hypothetical protein ACK56I_16320 [bacterium]